MGQAKERIVGLLRANNGVAFCRECLSAVLGLASDAATPAFAALAQSWEFEQDDGLCSRCRTVTVVFRALPRQYAP